MKREQRQTDTWLERPSTIRGLWIGFTIVLTLTVAAQAFIHIKGYFGVDGWFGFAAVFGFGACAAMVIVAKLLGFVLKRREQYYQNRPEDDDGRTGSEQ